VPTPEGQCLGRHVAEYALLLDTLDDVALLRESQDYRHGLHVVPARVALESPLALDGDVVFSCLKGAENGDGLVLRCFNPASTPATARITGPFALSRTRLDETGDTALPDGRFDVRAGEITTLRLRPNVN
jgi:alpha-mannosidase